MTGRRAPAPRADPTPWLQGLPPSVDEGVRLLVLGSFPGQASLAALAYYAHPRNAFWPIVSRLLGEDFTARPVAERAALLLRHGVGLWDVYARCRRDASADASIRDAELRPLAELLQSLPALQAVAHNGAASARWAGFGDARGVAVWRLPSTSPAFAAWSFERKLEAWRAAFAGCGLCSPAASSARPSFSRAVPARIDPGPDPR